MPRLILPEETLRDVQHPETLHGRVLVHHEIADRLTFGHGDFPGDSRMALYCDQAENRWEVWRLELDGKYSRAARSTIGARLGEELWWKFVAHLRAHDTRLGYDPVADLEQHDEARERELDRVFGDQVADIADTYLYPAYKKVGFDDYL